jgi:hypothetical protein
MHEPMFSDMMQSGIHTQVINKASFITEFISDVTKVKPLAAAGCTGVIGGHNDTKCGREPYLTPRAYSSSSDLYQLQ